MNDQLQSINGSSAPDYPFLGILWKNDRYDAHLSRNNRLSPEIFSYSFSKTPQNADSKFVDSTLTKILSYHHIDDSVTQLLVMGTNELIENSLKHVYGFKDIDESGKKNFIVLGLDVSRNHMHTYVITKSVPLDYALIDSKLNDNDALKKIGSGRGFMMMKLSFDMLYVYRTPDFLEFGSIKLF